MLITCLFCLGMSAYAQENRHLRLGDTVPNIKLAHMINFPTATSTLSNFTNKLLILDFWDVGCLPCIAGFPKMEKLQQLFPKYIRILLVTKSSAEDVRKLFLHSAIARNCTLPMAIADSNLSSLFAYQTVPAYAWIDKNGVLNHFTGTPFYLKEEFIKQFIDGKKLNMPLKDEYGNFNCFESLLTEGGGRNLSNVSYYSMITHGINFDGQFGLPLVDFKTGRRLGIHMLNQSRVNLFLSAYTDSLPSNGFTRLENRVILNLADSINYQQYDQHYLDDHWKQDNIFCYEARLPPERMHLLYKVMQRDLCLYFDVKVRIEKRIKPCLVLKALNPINPTFKIRSKGGKQHLTLPYQTDSLIMGNTNFGQLIFAVELLFNSTNGSRQILLNETAIDPSTPVDIRIVKNVKDLTNFRKQLQVFGLDLVPEQKSINVLILSH
ncbi:Thiol-disulfide isomerase or thioredoxin [bacterium A37T11]|nr:Thiol-disulfide isomerase or thioredoxin [bacterium A37T11]